MKYIITLFVSLLAPLGGTFKLIMSPGVDHHPHGLPDPTPVVDFIEKYTR